MCLCDIYNNYVYCDNCKDVFESLKASNIDNHMFNEVYGIVNDNHQKIRPIRYIVSSYILGLLSAAFCQMLVQIPQLW